MKKKGNILGIFDSGVGGFSVLQEIRKGTDADIFYFGDCARAPYGNRSEEEIIGFIKEALFNLHEKGVTHFVSACNSMSVHMTEKILDEVGIPKGNYIDMIDAARRIPFPRNARVLVIGTKATISSGAYTAILDKKKVSSDIFVPMVLAGKIEEGDSDAIRISVASVLAEAVSFRSTHIVYACTHYPLVDSFFREEALHRGWTGEFVDPAAYMAQEVGRWGLDGSRRITFETSKETPAFKEYSARCASILV